LKAKIRGKGDLFHDLLLARGGKCLKEDGIFEVEIDPRRCEGITCVPLRVEIRFGKEFPIAETCDGERIPSGIPTGKYYRDRETGRILYIWDHWRDKYRELGQIVEEAISNLPLTAQEKEQKKKEENKRKEEEETARVREEKARKRANLREWRRSLRNYLADLEKEVSRVRDLLKPRRSYKVIRDGFYEPRLGWPSDDDC
jgi:hypothetical protein